MFTVKRGFVTNSSDDVGVVYFTPKDSIKKAITEEFINNLKKDIYESKFELLYIVIDMINLRYFKDYTIEKLANELANRVIERLKEVFLKNVYDKDTISSTIINKYICDIPTKYIGATKIISDYDSSTNLDWLSIKIFDYYTIELLLRKSEKFEEVKVGRIHLG